MNDYRRRTARSRTAKAFRRVPPPRLNTNETNEMNQQKRPRLHPPLALLARKPNLTLAFAGSKKASEAQERPAPDFKSTLAPHELRRIVAGIVG
jgi:hypothetical protein